ncbi:Transposon Tf2-6 poly [Olea europaea subsp. europaea]|uniref:Transposon Tf2-6 poly n=1 Tax=Olea europaea subsp. europaea TaxID=158383 RepID=A0A8S0V8C3_OLEEU|nr:Transposon Tf2-6 poly [Olea europaea subsp. europaea]
MNSHKIFFAGEEVGISLIEKITESHSGNEYIIVAIDMVTRFVEAKAVPEKGARTFAAFLLECCGRYGVPGFPGEILINKKHHRCPSDMFRIKPRHEFQTAKQKHRCHPKSCLTRPASKRNKETEAADSGDEFLNPSKEIEPNVLEHTNICVSDDDGIGSLLFYDGNIRRKSLVLRLGKKKEVALSAENKQRSEQ